MRLNTRERNLHIYLYKYIHVCLYEEWRHAHGERDLHIPNHMNRHINIYIYIYMYLSTYIHPCIHHTYIEMYIYTHIIYVDLYIDVDICIYIYIYVCMHDFGVRPRSANSKGNNWRWKWDSGGSGWRRREGRKSTPLFGRQGQGLATSASLIPRRGAAGVIPACNPIPRTPSLP